MTAPDFRGDPPSHYLCSLLEEAGLPHLFTTRHFPGVSAFREPGPPLGPGAQELLVAVFSADCVPVLLYDPEGRRVAAVHAGWRGTVQGVAGAAVDALRNEGGEPEHFLAAIGPSIGPCCYEVDKPVIVRLDAAFP